MPIAWWIARTLIKLALVLGFAMLGGFVATHLGGFLAGVAGSLIEGLSPKFLVQALWVVGALMGVVAAVFRFSGVDQFAQTIRRAKQDAESSEAASPPPDQPPARRDLRWVLGCGLTFGLAGAMLGAMLGGVLVMSWFSLSYSPFAPDGWLDSISEAPATDPLDGRRSGGSELRTSHPIAVYAFLLPFALLTIAGSLLGSIGAALGQVREAD